VKNIHKLPPKPAAESDQIDSSQQNYPTSQDDGGLFEHMLPNYKERMADVISMLDKQKEMRK